MRYVDGRGCSQGWIHPEVTQQLVAELQELRLLIDLIEAMLLQRPHCQIEPLDTSR